MKNFVVKCHLREKLLQSLLKKGKKKVAEKVFLKTLILLETNFPNSSSQEILTQAFRNIQPSFEFKKARVHGLSQQIPGAKTVDKQESLAIRWVLDSARTKQLKKKQLKTKNYGFEHFLSHEICAAFKNESELVQKKLEVHKLAETNRALAVQRWW